MILKATIISASMLLSLAAFAQGQPKHHKDDSFQNDPITLEPPSLGVGFYLKRFWSSFFLPQVAQDHFVPEQDALKQLEALWQHDTLTWIGQFTFLIRLQGKAILTDPFFSEYAGPHSMGPRRFVDPDESPWESPQGFVQAAEEAGLSAQQAWIMKIGETRILPPSPRNQGVARFVQNANT